MSLDEVQSTLNSKELNERNEPKYLVNGEGLIVRGRPSKRENRLERKRSKSHSRSGDYKNSSDNKNGGNASGIRCYYCRKIGHIQRFCPQRQRPDIEKSKESIDPAMFLDGNESAKLYWCHVIALNRNG